MVSQCSPVKPGVYLHLYDLGSIFLTCCSILTLVLLTVYDCNAVIFVTPQSKLTYYNT